MEDLSSGMEGDISTKNTDKQIQWRRTKVLELSSQGNTQSDIAKTLHIGEATVSRDISSLRQQAHLNLKTHINDNLPEEYQNCMVGINQVLKICWEIVNKFRNVDNDNGHTVTMTITKQYCKYAKLSISRLVSKPILYLLSFCSRLSRF